MQELEIELQLNYLCQNITSTMLYVGQTDHHEVILHAGWHAEF